MARTLRFEALYPHRPELVWTALTDPEAIGDWLMPNDFRPEVGHLFTFRTKPAPGFDGIVHCEVLAVEPPRRLSYSWKGGGIDTVVTYSLAAEGANTRLVMEQSGFKGLRGFMVSRILGSGWKKIVGDYLRRAAGRVEGGRYHADPSAPAKDCHG
jgi:uncharacterized protein YndB with AHSA1/START domain